MAAAIQPPHVAPTIVQFVYPEGEKLKSGTDKKTEICWEGQGRQRLSKSRICEEQARRWDCQGRKWVRMKVGRHGGR